MALSKLGDSVFYYPSKNEFHADQPGPLAAVVTKVSGPLVNVAVFTGQGACEGRSSVPNNPASRPVGPFISSTLAAASATSVAKLPPLKPQASGATAFSSGATAPVAQAQAQAQSKPQVIPAGQHHKLPPLAAR